MDVQTPSARPRGVYDECQQSAQTSSEVPDSVRPPLVVHRLPSFVLPREQGPLVPTPLLASVRVLFGYFFLL